MWGGLLSPPSSSRVPLVVVKHGGPTPGEPRSPLSNQTRRPTDWWQIRRREG